MLRRVVLIQLTILLSLLSLSISKLSFAQCSGTAVFAADINDAVGNPKGQLSYEDVLNKLDKVVLPKALFSSHEGHLNIVKHISDGGELKVNFHHVVAAQDDQIGFSENVEISILTYDTDTSIFVMKLTYDRISGPGIFDCREPITFFPKLNQLVHSEGTLVESKARLEFDFEANPDWETREEVLFKGRDKFNRKIHLKLPVSELSDPEGPLSIHLNYRGTKEFNNSKASVFTSSAQIIFEGYRPGVSVNGASLKVTKTSNLNGVLEITLSYSLPWDGVLTPYKIIFSASNELYVLDRPLVEAQLPNGIVPPLEDPGIHFDPEDPIPGGEGGATEPAPETPVEVEEDSEPTGLDDDRVRVEPRAEAERLEENQEDDEFDDLGFENEDSSRAGCSLMTVSGGSTTPAGAFLAMALFAGFPLLRSIRKK